MQTELIIDVTGFGADPSGRTDSGPAVRTALQAARSADLPAVVRFPRGRYDFWPESATRRELYVSNTVGADERYRYKLIAILIEDTYGLRLDGGGSDFVFHGIQTPFAIIGSRHIRLENFSADFAVPTVVDVTVAAGGVGADGRPYRVLTVPDSNPYRLDGTSVVWEGEADPTGEPYWSGANGLEYTQIHNPARGRTWRGENPLFEKVEAIESPQQGTIQVVYAPGTRVDDVGLVYQIRNITRDQCGIVIVQSDSVQVSDARIYYFHGLGIVAQLSGNITVLATEFRAPERSGRWTAGFADFVQLSGTYGDASIRDCVFDGPHDDPINIHGTYLRLRGMPDSRTLEVEFGHPQTMGFPQFFPGHLGQILEAATLRTLETFTVESVIGPSGRHRAADPKCMVVRTTRPVRALESSHGVVVENLTLTPRVEITGNTFRHVPTRGILVTSPRPVLIEDNDFEGIGKPSIFVAGDAVKWYESGATTDVVIRGNRFSRSASPIILVEPTTEPSGEPVHGSISITGNTFVVDQPGSAIAEAHSVASFVFEGNDVTAATSTGTRIVVATETAARTTTDRQ